MTPFEFTVVVFIIALGAGLLGSLLGLGGGIIVVPALTLLFKIDIRYAIGASIVSVIATSSGAAAAYVRERMTNLRVGMLLEIATTSGALSGAYLAGVIAGRWLFIIFALVMGYSAFVMLRSPDHESKRAVRPDPLADRLALHGEYYDAAVRREISYQVTGTKAGLALMYLAGVFSGLLGIGSGILKVPAMDLVMRLPIKISTATSNFMIGVTAAASAGVYLNRGYVDPALAMPVMLGVLLGSTLGARVLMTARTRVLRLVFAAVILVLAAEMIYNGLAGRV
jgi:uncharacterized membrane protein YfcA